MTNTKTLTILFALSISCATACGDEVENPDQKDEEEVITTVELTLTPQGGGDAVVASFVDADGEGGADPVITNPTLAASTTYDVSVRLLNETVEASDDDYDIGAEIAEEAEDHQLFYGGSAVTGGLLTWTYGDVESDYTENTGDDLPVGLAGTLTTGAAGTGQLTVTLQHQPPVNDVLVKTSTSGVADGDTDVAVTFEVVVE